MGRPPIPVPPKYCHYCGAQMERQKFGDRLEDRAAFSRRVYCGRACMAKAMEKDTCQSVSHSRLKASRTAGPSCEICGASRKLHVHHKDENPFNNDPLNLQTLCPSCHQKSHSPNYMGADLRRKNCAHCSQPSMKLGLCATHLSRLRRHGHPLAKKVKIGSEWVLQVPSLKCPSAPYPETSPPAWDDCAVTAMPSSRKPQRSSSKPSTPPAPSVFG